MLSIVALAEKGCDGLEMPNTCLGLCVECIVRRIMSVIGEWMDEIRA